MKKSVCGWCVLWMCIVWGQSAQASRWAVIIGIERYRNPDINLEYTGDDAEVMFQILSTQGEIPEQNIRRLSDEEATQVGISEALRDWLPQRVKPGDFVVIYYSGHGIQGPDLDPQDEHDGKDEYLVPYDFDFATPEKIVATGVRDDLLAEWIGELPADTIVIFDSCYSGGGIKTISKGTPRNPYALLQRLEGSKAISSGGMQEEFAGLSENITFLASCQPFQQASEYSDLKHGIFTYYLAQGLQGQADQNNDGQVSITEAFTYTEQQMANDARTKVTKQQPLIWAKAKKENILISKTSSVRIPISDATPISAPKPTEVKNIQVDLRFDVLETDGTIKPGIEDEEYQSGTMIKVSFKVAQDCYLFVFNIDQDGHVYNFYPRDPEADQSIRVEKDQVYSVPARLDKLVGVERFYAVASTQPFSLSQDVLPAVDKEFQTKGLQIEPMKELDIPFSYKTISFKHR